ncbi:MAG: pilus (MSHA type) biogenesis protein MshL [Halofilum sp. (in: g-proteobacteria)]|nr:pilus (MSHA type) biogenesis protein MshL [Halofilum sp. (in: g-proteobacteria)]
MMNPAICHRSTRLVVVLAIGVLLTGCASSRDRHVASAEGPTLDRIREAVEDGSRSNASEDMPAEVQEALMPEVTSPLPSQVDQDRFDLSVRNAPARPFFMGLVEGTPYNMVVHPDVQGEVTLELKDVTVPQVMDIARRVYGYEYEEQENGYIVLPARLQSRIYYVDYLNVSRQGESNTRVNSGQVTNGGSGNDDSGSGSDSNDNSQADRTPSSRIKTESQANFWGRLRGTVQSLVGGGDGRSVIVDADAGLVVVRAMPGEHRDVAQYLEAAQASLQRQVILEAKIIEVTLSEAHQTGINWAALAEGSNGDAAFVGGAELVNGTNTVLSDPNFGLIDTNSIAGQTPDFGGLFAVGALTTDFAALIRLLDTQGDVQVLSSPRVSTVNNQKAVIKVGTDEFFVTDIESDQNTGTVTTQNTVDIELTPFFSGIALDVTPQIGRGGDVTLHVHPTVSEVVDQEKTLTVANQQQTLPLAFSSVRESDSVVRAQDGQVIVIGGLMQDQSNKRRAQSGGLGDIPILGALFRQSADSSRQSELVILLRPIVADSPSVWRDELDGVSERLRKQDGDGQ